MIRLTAHNDRPVKPRMLFKSLTLPIETQHTWRLNSRAISNHQGFTLVEMLVSLAILSLLITVLLMGFQRGLAIWERGMQQEQTWQMLLLRQQWLNTLFSQSLISTYSKPKEQTYVPYFQGSATQMSLMTSAPLLDNPGQVKPVRLKLAKDDNTSSYILYYQEGASHSDPGRDLHWNDPWIPLLNNLKEGRFSYEAPAFPLQDELELKYLPASEKQRYRDKPTWLNQYDTHLLWLAPRRVKLQFIDSQNTTHIWQFCLNTDAEAWRLEVYDSEE